MLSAIASSPSGSVTIDCTSASSVNVSNSVRLRGDRAVPYGDVMGLLNELRGADYLKIALVGLEARSAQ